VNSQTVQEESRLEANAETVQEDSRLKAHAETVQEDSRLEVLQGMEHVSLTHTANGEFPKLMQF
jgi:hypothetical protein